MDCVSNIYIDNNKNLRICGFINQRLYEDLKIIKPANYKNVVITSVGGYGYEAVMITKLFRKLNKQVIIDKYCLSACAHIIFMGSKNVIVNDKSIVAFHGSSYGISKNLESIYGKDYSKLLHTKQRIHLKKSAEEELALYNELNIDSSFLTSISNLYATKCIFIKSGNIKRIYYSELNYFSLNLIKKYKTDFSGYWPVDKKEAEILDKTYLKNRLFIYIDKFEGYTFKKRMCNENDIKKAGNINTLPLS